MKKLSNGQYWVVALPRPSKRSKNVCIDKDVLEEVAKFKKRYGVPPVVLAVNSDTLAIIGVKLVKKYKIKTRQGIQPYHLWMSDKKEK